MRQKHGRCHSRMCTARPDPAVDPESSPPARPDVKGLLFPLPESAISDRVGTAANRCCCTGMLIPDSRVVAAEDDRHSAITRMAESASLRVLTEGTGGCGENLRRLEVQARPVPRLSSRSRTTSSDATPVRGDRSLLPEGCPSSVARRRVRWNPGRPVPSATRPIPGPTQLRCGATLAPQTRFRSTPNTTAVPLDARLRDQRVARLMPLRRASAFGRLQYKRSRDRASSLASGATSLYRTDWPSRRRAIRLRLEYCCLLRQCGRPHRAPLASSLGVRSPSTSAHPDKWFLHIWPNSLIHRVLHRNYYHTWQW